MVVSGHAHRKPKREVIHLTAMSTYSFKEETVEDTGFGWHFHSEVEINLVLRGRGMRFVGDSIEPFQDGDLVMIGPNLPHACPKPGPGESLQTLVIQFPSSFCETGLHGILDFRPLARLVDRSRQGLKVQGPARIKATGILTEMAGLPPGSSRRAAKLLQLLSLLAEEADCRPLVRGPVRLPDVNPGDKRLQEVFTLIHDRLPEVHAEAALAEKFAMSPGAFSHFFRRSMGKSYLDYLGELRIGLACKALVETGKPIVEVAFEAGFNNLSNFHRRFKKLKGLTPMAFRRLARKDSGASRSA